MDRSFLSQPAVIAASRRFVCVRLITYEDKTEGEFLKAFNVTRSGEVENTVFTILSPDGKQQLARASRSARRTFNDAAAMAETMNRIGKDFEAKKTGTRAPRELPKTANVRLAVNVAACDGQPLVVLLAKTAKERRELEERLAPLAWNEAFLGRFVYVAASEAKELASIAGVKVEAGVLVVHADQFGLKGEVLRQVPLSASQEELVQCLKEGMAQHSREDKSFENHVREGHRKGIFWETVIPVTDPMEKRARERGRP